MLTLLILVVVMLGCHRQRCLGSQAMPADPARRTPGRSLRPEEEVVVVVVVATVVEQQCSRGIVVVVVVVEVEVQVQVQVQVQVVQVAATAQTLWKFRGGFRTGSGLQPSFLEVPTRLLFRTTTGFLCPLLSHVPPSVVKTSEQPGPNSWNQSLFKTRAHWAGGRVSTFRAVEGVT